MYDTLTRNTEAAARAAMPPSTPPEPAHAGPPNSSVPAAKPSLPPTSCGRSSESHFPLLGNPFSDSGQCGYALGCFLRVSAEFGGGHYDRGPLQVDTMPMPEVMIES